MREDDQRFADEVRAMLLMRALDITDGPPLLELAPPAPARRRHRQAVVAAVIAVLAMIGALAVVARDRDGSSIAERPAPVAQGPTTVMGWYPPASSRVSQGPVFAATGDPEDVAAAYFADRLEIPVEVSRWVVATGSADATWVVVESEERAPITGTIHLRLVDDRWTVWEVMTDGVELHDLRHEGDRVRGTISQRPNGVAVDVLTLDGEPVPGAPYPDRWRVGDRPYGTAAEGLDAHVDVPVDHQPVLVRASIVRGTLVSITEVRLDPPR